MPLDTMEEVSFWNGYAWVFGIKQDLWAAASRSYAKNRDRIEKPHLISLIDFRIPKKEKRLWILDFSKTFPLLVVSTWCASGSGSGEGPETKTVGKNNRQSCVGGFVTGRTWMSALGQKDKSKKSKLAMKLIGLDPTNDNADYRGIRWHGAHYVNPGRVADSWGCICPPQSVHDAHVKTLSHGSFVFAYFGEETIEV